MEKGGPENGWADYTESEEVPRSVDSSSALKKEILETLKLALTADRNSITNEIDNAERRNDQNMKEKLIALLGISTSASWGIIRKAVESNI